MSQKVVIITGWTGSEREVSLRSAAAVKNALASNNHTVEVFDFPQDIESFLGKSKPDFAFVMIHGKDGEDGKIPAMLELLGIPSQWAIYGVHALAINKIWTKSIWKAVDLPVANDTIVDLAHITLEALDLRIRERVGYPAVIKVPTEWSSNGVYQIANFDTLQKLWGNISGLQWNILIEEFIKGREVTISILEQPNGEVVALPIIEIIPPQGEEFDYINKYNGKTQEICPADISPDVAQYISDICLKAYKTLGVQWYGRIDAILMESGEIRLLEINTIPGFTDQSLFPLAARTSGLSFPELLEILMQTGISNFKNRS